MDGGGGGISTWLGLCGRFSLVNLSTILLGSGFSILLNLFNLNNVPERVEFWMNCGFLSAGTINIIL